MISPREIAALMKAVGVVLKEELSAAFAVITGRLNELDERLKNIPAGPPGKDGVPGETGCIGPVGEPGQRGDVGPQGDTGPVGVKGDPGLPGESIQGPAGERGTPGPTGDRGPQGLAGQDGLPGESIKGEQGDRGERGEKGTKGDSGEPGERGEKGDRGDAGASIRGDKGEPGIPGPPGPFGRDGQKGDEGRPGRDALQIDILPGIDESKTYQRGTFACHKGGTVYFTGREWLCVSRGIDFETDELSEDFRTRTRKTFYTDGTVKEYSWRIPAMLYREGFKDGTEYTRGDVVNYDNSSWICVVDSTKAKPFPSNLSDKPQDWRLMVRKGGNGKDGAPGIQGPPGKDFTPANGSGRR